MKKFKPSKEYPELVFEFKDGKRLTRIRQSTHGDLYLAQEIGGKQILLPRKENQSGEQLYYNLLRFLREHKIPIPEFEKDFRPDSTDYHERKMSNFLQTHEGGLNEYGASSYNFDAVPPILESKTNRGKPELHFTFEDGQKIVFSLKTIKFLLEHIPKTSGQKETFYFLHRHFLKS